MAKKTALGVVLVSDGQQPRWSLQNKELFMNDLSYFGDGTKIKITIEHFYPQRSLKQNGVLHWYCTELAEEVGVEPEDFKMMMKMKFLQREKLDKHGNLIGDPETSEVMMYIPSTSELTTSEMAEFIEKIRLWALDYLNYELPLPDANYKIHFLENYKRTITT